MDTVTMLGWIKDAKLKPDSNTGTPGLEIKLDCGVTDPETMRQLVDTWKEGKSQVRIRLEPMMEQVKLDVSIQPDELAHGLDVGGDFNPIDGPIDDEEVVEDDSELTILS